MDKLSKKDLRKKIGEMIDLGSTRLKENEYDIFEEIINNPEKYNGKTKVIEKKYREKDHRGNYDVEKTWHYTLNVDPSQMSINEKYKYWNDDGITRTSDETINSARDFLNLFTKFFKN